jgi:hypothetical protein
MFSQSKVANHPSASIEVVSRHADYYGMDTPLTPPPVTTAQAAHPFTPPPGWWMASDGQWYPPAAPPQPAPKKRRGAKALLVTLASCGGLFAVVIVIAAFSTPSKSTAGPSQGVPDETTESIVDPQAAQAALEAKIVSATTPEVDPIVKNPDAYRGQVFLMVAQIAQLDGATGPCSFGARWDSDAHKYNYEYKGDNARFVSGDGAKTCPVLDGIDEDDTVRLWAESTGMEHYDTQMGGRTTAPSFRVLKAEVIAKK